MEELSKEGESGRRTLNRWTRWIAFPLAFLQSYGIIALLNAQAQVPIIENLNDPTIILPIMLTVSTGTIFLMWLGELISEYGLGNGISILIFAGIVARLPTDISQALFSFNSAQIPVYLAFLAAAVAIIAAVVAVTEAERPVPVTYAKQGRGMKFFGGSSTYLPLRLNQAGVIPIIFALSLLLIPQMAATFFSTSSYVFLANAAQATLGFLQNLALYGAVYFVLVFLFTYFYTAVTFDPHQIAENLQKNGAFIPGVRPGNSTTEYLAKVITRITFVGALFLSVIAVLPIIMQSLTDIQSLALGGTALLIVVSVILDLARRIDAQISIREY
jgi:preprotein translocase subunit SecY